MNPPAPEDPPSPQGKGVRVADFDRSCATDEDCIVVHEGRACCLGCPASSIAKKASASYEAKLAEHRASCQQVKCPVLECEPFRARCAAGKCEAGRVK